MNKDIYTNRTIAHQLTHYLQHQFGIYLTETFNLMTNINLSNISHLNLKNASKEQIIKLYFNERQFGTHIDDLLYRIKKCLYEFLF